ncbi:MAG TPA: KpsF/GutQ family sugar-phosphate isomerase [Methylomirabilota bacterium]|nr:KpsF/GutQ family sugar-phosphate isomerase [Methylomirabilota bacterium]
MDRARLLALAERVLRLEAESIQALAARLDDHFIAAVDLLYRCRGRVIVTGMGKSSHVARKVAATMASTGTPAYFLHPAEGVHGDVGMVAQGDVAMVFSNSGETDELLAVLPAIKRLSVPVVLLTGNVASSLARQADVVVDVGVREEACPMNLAPTSSTTAALAMGDALAMALLELRGLRAEDYAALHPAGTLGWRALVKVRDLMHAGAAVPVVPESATMKQALEEMTAKRRGMTTVVDAAGRLVGIITDGDLRRLQLAGGPLLDRRAGDCMSRRPKRIEADALAAAALAMMEAHQITSLVITDDAGRPAAFIHLHDILSSKIA